MERLDADWRTAPLDERRQTMLAFAEKLTLTPGEMSESDFIGLRTAGFGDRDIHDLVEVVAYYAYVNRVAAGLGVAIEPWFDGE